MGNFLKPLSVNINRHSTLKLTLYIIQPIMVHLTCKDVPHGWMHAVDGFRRVLNLNSQCKSNVFVSYCSDLI